MEQLDFVTPDYFSQQKSNRDLPNIWMLEVTGVLTAEQTATLLKFAQDLAAKIEDYSQQWTGEKCLTTSFFEGR
ncbi:hypothetical protein JNK13_11245 [bacterium]|nr:hypothetical protein [bacterium]